ncbi:hypothetical protein CSC82_11575 [Rhodobacteraceae bacterium 4F10]|nr:hypothetical protein CSC82_11575 [Rhodobacteraceae bacterium 4F10]
MTAQNKLPKFPARTDVLDVLPPPQPVEGEHDPRDVVTVLVAPYEQGKTLSLDDQGCLKKSKPHGHPGACSAVTVAVQTPERLAEVLRAVGASRLSAVLLGFYDHDNAAVDPATGRSEPFLALSRKALSTLTGLDVNDVDGWHDIPDYGPCVGRLKNNITAGRWGFFDYDVPAGMPNHMRFDSFGDWVAVMDKVVGGFAAAPKVQNPSSTSRVMIDGKPYASAGWHCFVKIDDPERLRALKEQHTFVARALARGLARVTQHEVLTIADTVGFQAEQLCFACAPVSKDQRVAVTPPEPVVHDSGGQAVTLAGGCPDATPEERKALAKARQVPVGAVGKSAGVVQREEDHGLTLQTKVETRDRGTTTIGELYRNGHIQPGSLNLRCNNPLRPTATEFSGYLGQYNGSGHLYLDDRSSGRGAGCQYVIKLTDDERQTGPGWKEYQLREVKKKMGHLEVNPAVVGMFPQDYDSGLAGNASQPGGAPIEAHGEHSGSEKPLAYAEQLQTAKLQDAALGVAQSANPFQTPSSTNGLGKFKTQGEVYKWLSKNFFKYSANGKVRWVRKDDLGGVQIYSKTELAHETSYLWRRQGNKNKPLVFDWMETQPMDEIREMKLVRPDAPLDPGVLNLWRGYGCDAEQGDWSLFRDYMLEVLCDGNNTYLEWLLDWMAHRVKYPDLPAGTTLGFFGAQGSGKTFFEKVLLSLFHTAHTQVFSNDDHIMGRFADLSGVVAAALDEATFAPSRKTAAKLKHLTTGTTIVVERKGHQAFQVPNSLGLVMTGNDDFQGILDSDDRRHFKKKVNPVHAKDTVYFGELARVMFSDPDKLEGAGAGAAALLYDLLRRDVSADFNKREVISTRERDEHKVQSLMYSSPVEAWWLSVLAAGDDDPLFTDRDAEDMRIKAEANDMTKSVRSVHGLSVVGDWSDGPLVVPVGCFEASIDAYNRRTDRYGAKITASPNIVWRSLIKAGVLPDKSKVPSMVATGHPVERHAVVRSGRAAPRCRLLPALEVCREAFAKVYPAAVDHWNDDDASGAGAGPRSDGGSVTQSITPDNHNAGATTTEGCHPDGAGGAGPGHGVEAAHGSRHDDYAEQTARGEAGTEALNDLLGVVLGDCPEPG